MGHKAIPPGAWSKAAAAYFDKLMKAQDLKDSHVLKAMKISKGRFPLLLTGERPWYLEDVQVFCEYFNLDFKKFLVDLQRNGAIEVSAPIGTFLVEEQVTWDLAADFQQTPIGLETDEGYESA
jgi:hypothetical protein